jgi:hypothetical protein
VGEVAEGLPRCSDVVGFAEKLAVALAPLRELIWQECAELERSGVSEEGLYTWLARGLVVARFGEPSEEREGDGRPTLRTLIYRCVHEDGGEDEAVVEINKDECGVFLVAYTVAR